MRTVRGAATGTRVLTEMVLAHELTHALEDQRYGLGIEDQGGSDDAALARLALVEGSASELMYAYAERHFTPEETLGGVLGSAFADTGSLPGFLQAQLVFPYTGGQAFVAALRERAGGRWTLVDLAERTRPPVSTEQVMHPEQVGARSSRRCRCGRAPRRRSGRAGSARPAACSGSSRRASCSRARAAAGPRRPPRAGAGTATSCGAAAAATRLRRAVPARRGARGALALGHAAPTRGSSPRSFASGCATGGVRRGRRRARRRGGAWRGGHARDGADRCGWRGASLLRSRLRLGREVGRPARVTVSVQYAAPARPLCGNRKLPRVSAQSIRSGGVLRGTDNAPFHPLPTRSR